jgi:hypothetical protein
MCAFMLIVFLLVHLDMSNLKKTNLNLDLIWKLEKKTSEKNKANSYSWAESNQLNHLSTHLLGPLSPIARPSFFPIAAPVLTYMWVPPGSRMALGWHGLNR